MPVIYFIIPKAPFHFQKNQIDGRFTLIPLIYNSGSKNFMRNYCKLSVFLIRYRFDTFAEQSVSNVHELS